MEQFFTGIRKKEQGNKFVTKYYIHVITSHNVEQEVQKLIRSDVVIHNKLGNGETCQGLRHWRLLSNLKNNFSKPVRNDMDNKNKLDCFAFARNDEFVEFEDNKILNQLTATPTHTDSHVSPQLNGSLCKVQNDNTAVVQNNAKDKTLTNLFPYFPISFSLNKKLRRFRILSWIIGGSAGSTQPSPGRATLSFRSCQNPQSGMTFIKQPAFTLAEVLITLGIIGIVAAMTIPNLMTKNIQKQTVVKLQKAISIMNQAYKMSFDDVGEANINEAFEMGADKYFETYWAPYIKAAVLCNTYQQCGYKSNKPWVTASGAVAQVGLIGDTSGSRLPFYTADGTLYLIFVGVGTGNWVDGKPEVNANASILVDINGKDGPNKFGRDVFMLKRIPDGGGVQPIGYDLAESDVEANCKNSWFGNTCAEKIRRAGWKIDKSYPWK